MNAQVRLARTPEELRSAFRLLHDEYVRMGYQQPDPLRLRILPQYLLPTSHTLIMLSEGGIVGTATLVEYGSRGLPMEAEYLDEIRLWRARGHRPIEVSGLAARRTTLLALFRAVQVFSREALGSTDLVITVNPAHEEFYRNSLLFVSMGPVRPCIQVQDAPAVPLRHDLTRSYANFLMAHGDNLIGRYMAGRDADAVARQLSLDTAAAALARRLLSRELTPIEVR